MPRPAGRYPLEDERGYTLCPECDAPAEIRQRFVLENTDGPIEHATVGCVRRHWFTLPVAHLEHTVMAVAWAVTDALS